MTWLILPGTLLVLLGTSIILMARERRREETWKVQLLIGLVMAWAGVMLVMAAAGMKFV